MNMLKIKIAILSIVLFIMPSAIVYMTLKQDIKDAGLMIVGATSVFQGYQGGTGTSTVQSSDVDKVLAVASSSPFLTYKLVSSGGSVTSVDMTVPTGLSISGNPITTSGALALTLTSGYQIPTTTRMIEWDTAYTDRLKWDGGATGLVAATGRTSLGLTDTATIASTTFYLASNPNSYTVAETTSTIGTLIDGSTATTAPADTDRFSFSDAIPLLRHITWANIKASIKSYLNGLFTTGYQTPSFTIASTSWSGTATTTIPLGFAMTAETWATYGCYFTEVSTSTIAFGDNTDWMTTITATTTPSQTSVSSNNTFIADEKRYVRIAPVTGSANYLSCSVKKSND